MNRNKMEKQENRKYIINDSTRRRTGERVENKGEVQNNEEGEQEGGGRWSKEEQADSVKQ